MKTHHVINTYEDLLLRLVSLIANMWTVPLSLEAHRNAESALNVILTHTQSMTLYLLYHVYV